MIEEREYAVEKFDFDKRPCSYSSLKHILRSPLHFSHYRFHRKPPTAAMEFGNIVDCLLLTPEKFDSKYHKSISKEDHPDALFTVADLNAFIEGPKGKDTKPQLIEIALSLDPKVEIWDVIKRADDNKAEGKTLVTAEQMEAAEAIVHNIKTNPKTKWLLDATHTTQRRLEWKDKKTGLKVIAYLDGEADRGRTPIIWDLKLTADASENKYPRQAADMLYHLQAGTYTTGYIRKTGKFADFYQIVAESKPPYAVNCYKCESDFVDIGKHLYRNGLDRVRYCIDNDSFDAGYDFLDTLGYSDLDLPGYIKKQHED